MRCKVGVEYTEIPRFPPAQFDAEQNKPYCLLSSHFAVPEADRDRFAGDMALPASRRASLQHLLEKRHNQLSDLLP